VNADGKLGFVLVNEADFETMDSLGLVRIETNTVFGSFRRVCTWQLIN
jgi:hypothetical protein